MKVPYPLVIGLPKESQRELQRNFQEIEKLLVSTGTGIDAVIDPDLTADVPLRGLFTTVFAALTSLKGSGWTAGESIGLVMKGRNTGPFGTTKAVTETANIPSTLMPPGGLKILGMGAPTWNLAGQTVTGTGSPVSLMLEDVYVLSSLSTAPFLGMNFLNFQGGGFNGAGSTPLSDNSTSFVFVVDAKFQSASPGASLYAWFVNTHFSAVANATVNVSVSQTLAMYGCKFDGAAGGLSKWNIAAVRAVFAECEGAATVDTSDSIMALSFNGGTTQCVFVSSGGRGGNGATNRQSALSLDMGGQTKASIVIFGGTYHDVVTSGTTTSSTDGGVCIVHCTAKSAVSVIGPADIAISSRYLTVGGARVVGSAHLSCSGNGDALTGQSMTDSNLQVSVGPGGTPANCRAYNLDAGCLRNVISFTGASGFGLANINLGANNFIFDHTGVAPSGAAGGDLTGSYPNPALAAIIVAGGPTGDATHVPQITWDAKGRVTAVSSILITGVTPASHASTHARGGTDPLDAVFKDFTQAFLMAGAS